MRKYDKREVKKFEQVQTGVYCDQCETDIEQTPHEHFYEVQTSHNCWGNDSMESIREHDLCSMVCVTKHMHDYYNQEDVQESFRYEIVREDKSEIWRD
ncbi:hypothetical protein CSV75_04475 [Sporosarcina sp. P18a]|uniref:hypothetical protein n=1 Tax=Sporosarcina sp. P18a TaxID=2048259 RepID=UPI000C16748B|nr:hypothetical protein [Sporosarcina sp. P18a]PIC81041.1 hypothetical protein CSV75_04475 [Sporosarcina sp. P18a]